MCKPTVKIVLVAVVMAVKNYECKDFVLSASDQSLIEMMKHYLHTSRRLECPNQGKTSNSGFYLNSSDFDWNVIGPKQTNN